MNGRRVLLFSYGSGLASSLYTLRFNLDNEQHQNELNKMCHISNQNKSRLDQRIRKTPADYRSAIDHRIRQIGTVGKYAPQAEIDALFPSTFYIQEIDGECRRLYAQSSPY